MIINTKDLQRDKIIDAASELFAKFGYKKTSLDDIASATNKTKTALYYYFKSKEAVFQAVIEKEADILRNAMMHAISRTKEPENKLRSYFTTRLKMLKKVSIFYDAMKSELLDHLAFMDEVRTKYLNEEVMLVKSILSDGIISGNFKIKNLDLTAQTIVLTLKGIEVPVFGTKDPSHFEENLKDLFNIICKGISK